MISNPEYQKALDLLSSDGHQQDGVALMKQIAESGDTMAMCDYGQLFITPGGPVTQNGKEAFHWFTLAAGYNDDRGQFLLGKMYYDGESITRNYIQASKWFTLSAEKGYALSQYYLGHMYFNGNGVPRDLEEAKRWYLLSVDRGCNEARIALADIYISGALGTVDVLAANNLYKAAMDDEYPIAFYKVGMMYYNGVGTPQNLIKASTVFRKGTELGEYGCYFMLGKMYFNGLGVQKDVIYGKRYMGMAENNGFVEAREYLDSIDKTRRDQKKWTSVNNTSVPVEALMTPDLLHIDKDSRLSVQEKSKKKKTGWFRR